MILNPKSLGVRVSPLIGYVGSLVRGYLVGTVDRWNKGKRAELADRKTHQSMLQDIASDKSE